MTNERVVIVPGNGGGDVEHANWYGWLRNKLIEVCSKPNVLLSLNFRFHLSLKLVINCK